MKVLLVNGSPHAKGCTYTALSEVAAALNKQGVETEIYQLGVKAISGCIACRQCYQTGKCFMDDQVNEFAQKADNADGFVFGSPVYYASANGSLTAFLDRLFYSGGKSLRYKPGASIISCRRGGATAAFDQLNKYFTISNMPIISSQYWNMVHGNTPEEVKQDLEGLQTMRVLGSNMAWILKCMEAGKQQGITIPAAEERQITNFIR